MADLEQTPFGWRAMTPDGPVEIPDEIAREAFPDHFAQPAGLPQEHQLAGMVPVPGTAAEAAYVPPAAPEEPQRPVPPWEAPEAAPQPQPPAQPAGLPPGIQSASYSYRGTAPYTETKGTQIDVASVGAPLDDIAKSRILVGDRQKDALAVEHDAQVEVDQLEADYADEEKLLREHQERTERGAQLLANDLKVKELEEINARRAAVPQMDPGRAWNNMSNFDQGMAMMTMGIQGFITAGKGPNAAVDLALKMIDKDMDAQASDIQTAKDQVLWAERGYDRIVDKLEAEKLFRKEKRIMQLETLSAGLKAGAMKVKSKFTQAKTMAAAAAVDEATTKEVGELVHKRVGLEMAAINSNNQNLQEEANRRQRAAQHAASMKLERDKMSADGKKNGAGGATLVGVSTGFNIGGKEFLAPGERDSDRATNQTRFQTRGDGAANGYAAAEKLKQLVGPNGLSAKQLADPDIRAQIKQLSSEIVMATSSMSDQSLSKSSDKDMELFENIGSGKADSIMSNVFGKGSFDRLSRFQTKITESQNRFARSFGGEYANARWTPPPLEEIVSAGTTSAREAVTKLSQTGLNPKLRESESTGQLPKAGVAPYSYVPRDDDSVPPLPPEAGQTTRPITQRGANPEMDQVGAITSYAQTVAADAESLTVDELGKASMTLRTKARDLMKAGYRAEGNSVDAAADYLMSKITEKATRPVKDALIEHELEGRVRDRLVND